MLLALASSMAITFSSISLADAARVARGSDTDRTRPRGQPPTAASAIGPAVVNHVDSATAPAAAADGGEAARKTGPERPEEEHAEQIRELKKRDAEVRAHEQAHAAAGGSFAGSPSYSYQRGPDGRSYAVGGEVPIDISAVSGDPEATIQKMQQVKRAALAPRDPSDADRSIAATADAQIMAARREQMREQPQASDEEESAGNAFGSFTRRSVGAAAYAAASAS